MSPAALRAQIETALSPKFDVSFTIRDQSAPALLPSGITKIDFPRGTLSEIFGLPSSGRTGLLLAALARTTQLPECCAIIDAGDTFDPVSGSEAGIDLKQLLWIRCKRNAEHALKAADLLVQSGGFGMIVLDLAGVPVRDARRISLASWFRLRHTVEKTGTALVAVSERPNASSCSTLQIETRQTQFDINGTLLRSIDFEAQIGPRSRAVTESKISPVFQV